MSVFLDSEQSYVCFSYYICTSVIVMSAVVVKIDPHKNVNRRSGFEKSRERLGTVSVEQCVCV